MKKRRYESLNVLVIGAMKQAAHVIVSDFLGKIEYIRVNLKQNIKLYVCHTRCRPYDRYLHAQTQP